MRVIYSTLIYYLSWYGSSLSIYALSAPSNYAVPRGYGRVSVFSLNLDRAGCASMLRCVISPRFSVLHHGFAFGGGVVPETM